MGFAVRREALALACGFSVLSAFFGDRVLVFSLAYAVVDHDVSRSSGRCKWVFHVLFYRRFW